MKFYWILLLALPMQCFASNKGIVEGLAATGNTIYIDTTNVRVGIANAAPAYALDVSSGFRETGDAYMGGSTVTATGNWTTFTPGNVVGCNGAMTTTSARYTLIGKLMFFSIDLSCTSNATNWTVTFPYAFNNSDNYVMCNISKDNGSTQTTPGLAFVDTGGQAQVDFSKDTTGGSATWTNSGSKRVICNGTFELK